MIVVVLVDAFIIFFIINYHIIIVNTILLFLLTFIFMVWYNEILLLFGYILFNSTQEFFVYFLFVLFAYNKTILKITIQYLLISTLYSIFRKILLTFTKRYKNVTL